MPTSRPAVVPRDVYADLLRDTRGLIREAALAREHWFASLPWERKEESLFELEMLFKGLVCFGNPRNHTGSAKRSPSVAHDFVEETRVMRDGLDRAVTLLRELLGDRDRAYTFSRYLESVIPEDAARSRLVKDQLTQDTPEEALFLLRNALSSHLDLADGMLRLGRVSNRIFHALHATITREIGRNAYFNPLVTLEFRAEFDRIRTAEVLESLMAVESEASHRVVALTFLTLFRALRYVSLVDEYATDPAAARRAFVVLAVLRSDLRALTRFLTRKAADVMSDGLERELLKVPAREIEAKFDRLEDTARRIVALRSVLDTIANGLRIEVRRTYERDLPAPDAGVRGEELGPHLVVATASLRATLHEAVRSLCAELRPLHAPPQLALDEKARRAVSERLRREIWMFAQVLRAFLAKADAMTEEPDLWSSQSSFQFVREFLGHFRAIGYQLVRSSDYERLDPFLAALEQLREIDLLDQERLDEVVGECRDFYVFLEDLFQRVSRRTELDDLPFDRRSAAETLKIYLGAA